MTRLTIGIDPGKSGAIAALDEHGDLLDVVDMPTTGEVSGHLIRDLLHQWQDTYTHIDTIVVEEVAAFPKNGSIGNFKLGMAYGIVLGVVAAGGWPLVRVRPSVWKKAAGLSSDKDLSRRKAIDAWPAHAAMFARKKDDGRAEAALLARWHQEASK